MIALGIGKIRATWASLPIELVVGTVMFVHGLPKLANPSGFAERAVGGIPIFLAYLVIAAEVGGGLLLLAGLLVRLSAFGVLCVMTVAVTQVHWVTGLTGPGGFEFALTLLAASISLLILGPDPLSIDENAGAVIYRSRESSFRRDSLDIGSPLVKAAAALLMLAGIALPLARAYLGVPEGTAPLVIAFVVGLASVVVGATLLAGKPWAYIPAFIISRLYLAASTLLLFWVKFTVRGLVALLLSFALLALLRSARRAPNRP